MNGFSSRILLALVIALAGCSEAPSDGGGDFAVLAQADTAFARATRGTALSFPKDHGAHPDFRIEWWYLTANLVDELGRPWGLQWTLFRTAIRSPEEGPGAGPWQSDQVYMAHFAVSAPQGHRAFQRYARGGDHRGVRQAGVRAEPFAAWLDDWRLQSSGRDWLPLTLNAQQADVSAKLALSSDRPLVLQGDAGFSQKHPQGGGSYYYSQPWLDASGTLSVGSDSVRVTGQAWLDREWSSQFLQGDQQGWDWFALHLASGDKLMAFQLRGQSGERYRHGVLLRTDGTRAVARSEELELVPQRTARLEGRQVPVAWRLLWPGQGIDLRIEAGYDDQWMRVDFPYWEGRVDVEDADGKAVGVGYLEMTGYGASDS